MSGAGSARAAGGGGIDLAGCDREPIHVPGSIQPHGLLFVLAAADATVLQASENVAEVLGRPVSHVLGRPLAEVLGAAVADALIGRLDRAPERDRPVLLRTVRLDTAAGGPRAFHAVAHRTGGGVVLELEADATADDPADPYPVLDAFAGRAERAASVADLARAAAEEVRRLTGFDRVLVYQFDPDGHGTVVGEDRNDRLPALLHHRFPASDIPAQARELYRHNRLRIIPDAGYRPVPVVPAANPVTGGPLDMTYAVLRSVSPVHVEYMKNMETRSSMSVSVLRDGRLWGLISCHHRDPKAVPFAARATCDLLARAFSLRLSALEHARDYERRIGVREAYAKLLAGMADRLDYAAGLAERPDDLLAFAEAGGAAVLTEGGCVLVGATPAEADVRRLADWLFREVREEVYATDALPVAYPPAAGFKDAASGVLAVAVSKLHPSYVLWFRPEVVRTIAWGGDPYKPADRNGDAARVHPRRSFATWRETVRLRSRPWRPAEVEAAAELRNAIVGVVLKKAEELAGLTAELRRSNAELEAFSYSVSHDLRAPLRHVVGYAEMLRDDAAGTLSPRAERCVATIIESSEFAGTLVDKLLAYARLGRGELQRTRVDLTALVAEARRDVAAGLAGRAVTWHVADLPAVEGDLMMLRLAVRNLLDNAAKYTRGRAEAVIEVGARDEGDEVVVFVRDNGTGFDMKYADKLFGVFQRLHRMEDYEGTGIGLANVRRVAERHGGRAWAEGEEGRGATFYVSLPKPRG
jgi:chemotaxis family two-component system sensor kinase Cph1